MAGVGRSMSSRFISTTRSVLRVCSNCSEVAAAGPKRGVGSRSMTPAMPAARPAAFSHPSTKSVSEGRRPASLLGGEMACAQSLLPLHSAIATSRMVAQLTTTAGTMLQDDEDGT
ncbi:unnamed protein product [Sphagnum jensenii]|uniref:Uncharacterized protein n=1 Tax=Sphagnum jensenii TaxID=128206 RepID=A0ABP1AE03_9BRYO